MKPVTVTVLRSLLLVGAVSFAANAAAQQAGVQISDKVARKISMALGEEVGDFVVTQHEEVESSAGSNATQYTIRTSSGKRYKCQVIQPSRAGKIFSFGTASGADALCTEFAGQGDDKPATTSALRAKNSSAPPQAAPAVAIAISDKAAKKISMAIGEETDRFVVTHQGKTDAPVGMKGTEYTVRTSGGKTYKCQLLETSGLGKLVTFGTVDGADAMCTDFTKGSKDQGKTNQANCNALLRAAHRCE